MDLGGVNSWEIEQALTDGMRLSNRNSLILELDNVTFDYTKVIPATVTATSSYSTFYAAPNVIDYRGVHNTGWKSWFSRNNPSASFPEVLVFDFNRSVSLDSFRFCYLDNFDNRQPHTYTLHHSSDGVNWLPVTSLTNGLFDPVSGLFVDVALDNMGAPAVVLGNKVIGNANNATDHSAAKWVTHTFSRVTANFFKISITASGGGASTYRGRTLGQLVGITEVEFFNLSDGDNGFSTYVEEGYYESEVLTVPRVEMVTYFAVVPNQTKMRLFYRTAPPTHNLLLAPWVEVAELGPNIFYTPSEVTFTEWLFQVRIELETSNVFSTPEVFWVRLLTRPSYDLDRHIILNMRPIDQDIEIKRTADIRTDRLIRANAHETAKLMAFAGSQLHTKLRFDHSLLDKKSEFILGAQRAELNMQLHDLEEGLLFNLNQLVRIEALTPQDLPAYNFIGVSDLLKVERLTPLELERLEKLTPIEMEGASDQLVFSMTSSSVQQPLPIQGSHYAPLNPLTSVHYAQPLPLYGAEALIPKPLHGVFDHSVLPISQAYEKALLPLIGVFHNPFLTLSGSYDHSVLPILGAHYHTLERLTNVAPIELAVLNTAFTFSILTREEIAKQELKVLSAISPFTSNSVVNAFPLANNSLKNALDIIQSSLAETTKFFSDTLLERTVFRTDILFNHQLLIQFDNELRSQTMFSLNTVDNYLSFLSAAANNTLAFATSAISNNEYVAHTTSGKELTIKVNRDAFSALQFTLPTQTLTNEYRLSMPVFSKALRVLRRERLGLVALEPVSLRLTNSFTVMTQRQPTQPDSPVQPIMRVIGDTRELESALPDGLGVTLRYPYLPNSWSGVSHIGLLKEHTRTDVKTFTNNITVDWEAVVQDVVIEEKWEAMDYHFFHQLWIFYMDRSRHLKYRPKDLNNYEYDVELIEIKADKQEKFWVKGVTIRMKVHAEGSVWNDALQGGKDPYKAHKIFPDAVDKRGNKLPPTP